MPRRADIQGLRAVAVLAVLLFHAGVPGVAGGYVGVDVFFVVSGYLITSLLVRERTERGRISLSAFWSRRVRRLLPVSALVALATVGASWIWLEPLRVRDAATDAIAVATFSSNLVFADRGADYLQSSLPPSPFQHYWSLAVEEQFYVLWPILVVLVCLGAAGAVEIRRRVGSVAVAVAVASFAACMVAMQSSVSVAFFWPHTRAFELAVGALVAVLPAAAGARDRLWSSATAWVGLAVIVACVVLFDERTAFPGPWALVPVAATAVLLRGGESAGWAPVALLRAAPLQWMGARSFSAYLWHWPPLVIAASVAGRELRLPESLAITAGALVLAEATWRWPEERVRLAASVRGRRAATLALGLACLVGGTGLLARNNPPTMTTGAVAAAPELGGDTTTSTSPDAPGAVTAVPVVPTTPPPPTLPRRSAPISAVVEAARATGLPANLEPSLMEVRSNMPVIYSNGCHGGFGVTAPKKCVYGDETSPVVVGVYGDSHAAQWFPAFEKIAIKRGWKLHYYTKRGCPPAEIEVFSSVLGKVYTECGPWRRNVLEQMTDDGVRVVFVAHFDRLLSAQTRIPPWQKEWRAGLRGTIEALESRGIVPVLVEDTPWPGQDVPSCLSKNYVAVGNCSQPVSQAYRDDLTEVRADFEAEGKNVLWVRQWFCDTTCPTVMGNLLVYRDDNHITATFASHVAKLMDAAVADFVDRYGRPR